MPARHNARAWSAGAIAIGLSIALIAALRGPVAEWLWPEAEAERLGALAEAAIRQGRLSAGDGSGARELYEAALAVDPDRAEARAGLARVALAALDAAGAATERGAFADAHAHLRLARSLSAPRAQTEAVAEALRAREAAVAGIDELLVTAETARKAGHLRDGEDAALPIYRRVLALQPKNPAALAGREDALSELLTQAREDLRRGRLAEGVEKIAVAAEFDPGHIDLPDARARWTQALEGALRRADADLRAGRLERAADVYRLWSKYGTDGDAAEQALARVARAYLARARRASADFDFDRARADIEAAREAGAETQDLLLAREDLQRAELARRRHASAPPTRDARRRAAALLREAAEAEQRGEWIAPPGDSVYDKLRAARALTPDDPAVTKAIARFLPQVRECFERELRDNRLQRARGCLDARIAIEGESRQTAQGRRRLAERWLAMGEQRLGAGEYDAARAALDAARALAPGSPAVEEFAERLHKATLGR